MRIVPSRLLLGVALVLALGAVSACREETPAMKKANLGFALSNRGHQEKAIEILHEATRLDPKLAMAQEFLGLALERSGKFPPAIRAYQETVRLDPVRDSAYASLGCLMLSTGGDRDAAEAALDKAIEINRTHSQALGCLGALHLDRRNFSATVEFSERALSFNPQNIQAHLNLGIAYAETGEIDRARKEIERTIALAHGDKTLILRAQTYLDGLNHPPVEGLHDHERT